MHLPPSGNGWRSKWSSYLLPEFKFHNLTAKEPEISEANHFESPSTSIAMDSLTGCKRKQYQDCSKANHVDDMNVAMDDVENESPAKRQRTSLAAAALPDTQDHSAPSSEAQAPSNSMLANQIRDVLESQLSMDILLKHDEIRRIDQELAKCHIALEQLRRCHIIPYAGDKGSDAHAVEVDSGPAPIHSDIQPSHASAFGITHGPYSRHYASWLIPDPMFDNIDNRQQSPGESRDSSVAVAGRQTRNNHLDDCPTTTHVDRKSAGVSLGALPDGFMLSKPPPQPIFLRRVMDGKMVQLVCEHKHALPAPGPKELFRNVQGFINHCRISHRIRYETHEDAAINSGRLVSDEEMAEKLSKIFPASRSVPSPVLEKSSAPGSAGVVHEQIRNVDLDPVSIRSLLARIADSREMVRSGRHPRCSIIPSSLANASRSTTLDHTMTVPHLSALLQARGVDIDLGQLVAEVSQSSSVESDDDMQDDVASPEPTSPATSISSPQPKARLWSGPNGSARTQSRPSPGALERGRKSGNNGVAVGRRPVNRKPLLSSLATYTPFVARSRESSCTEENQTDALILSPHTVGAQSAPSLVSDDDFDDHSDSDSALSIVSQDDMELRQNESTHIVDADSLARHRGNGALHRLNASHMDVDIVNHKEVGESSIVTEVG